MLAASLLFAPVAVVAVQAGGQWWGGSNECGHGCLQSAWSGNQWPAPSSFCGGGDSVRSCLESSCKATPAAYQSFSLLSSSACAQYASCSAAGSTGVYTITATGQWGPGGGHGGPGFGGGGGPGGYGGQGGQGGYGGFGPWGNGGGSWGAGIYTVTGCPWNGSPWFNSAGGEGWNGWGPTGAGWSWSTRLQTVTATYNNNGVQATTTGVATVANAVSGTYTSATTYGIGPTAVATVIGNAAPAGITAAPGMKVVGALLGGAAVVAGML